MGTLIILALFSTIAAIVYLISKRISKKEISKINDEIERLKKEGIKINVNLNDCEIKSSEYVETISRNNNESDAAAYILGGKDHDQLQTDIIHQQCVLVFKLKSETGQKAKTFVSNIIQKDCDTLSFYLDKYKLTTIYFNEKTGGYYFDLSFLEQGL